jgi:two-component system sensor histidine kinase BaeS
VIVATPIDTVGETVRDLAIALGAAGVIGLIIAICGTLWLSRREARPLRELAEAARTTASSGFETPITEEATGSLEARELRLALADLVQRQQEVLRRERAFFADSSHVLRTPLAVLQGELEILEQGVYGQEREEVMAHARASVETLSRAVSGLLLLAREQEGPADPSWEVIDLSSLLRRLAEGAAITAPKLTVEQEIEDGVEVAGDPHQLHDLFTSVIENACRYTAAGGNITVALRAATEKGDAETEIRDTGIGFSSADLSRATERFYRGPAARRMFPGGSGLGLAIAHRIVGLHRGTIQLDANNGKGAAVRITLPLVG